MRSISQGKRLLNSTCSVYVSSNSSNNGFPQPSTPGTSVATNVPCRIEKLKPDVAAVLYMKLDVTNMYRLYFAGYPVTDANGTTIDLDIKTITYSFAIALSDGSIGYYQLESVCDVDLMGQLLQVDCIRKPYKGGT